MAFPPRIPTDGVSVIDADANETRSLFGCLPILNAMPSWLVSLVLHLLALIVFASLILPPSNRLGIPTLFIGFSDPDPHPDSIEPTILLDPTNSPEPSVDESAVPNDQDQPSPPQQDTNQPSEDGGPPSPAAKKKAMAIAVSLKPFGRWAASLTQKQHELHAEHDKVVDRFIAYDLGRLRGRAGRKALQEFQALGTTAIPALVRGVNKSAQYTGSCPVSVISSKLASELENTKNQGFIRYAIDHLGDDVAWNMPHANRVIALRDKIQKKYGETVRQTDLLVDSMDLPKPIADRTKNLVKLRIKNITN